MTGTVVVPNARLELLRGLADWRDVHEQLVRAERWDPDFCRRVPLEGGWQNAADDIALAARECAAVGEIELIRDPVFGSAFVAITDAGYARIRAHDLMGETTQEPAAPGALGA